MSYKHIKKITMAVLPWFVVVLIAYFFGKALAKNWNKLGGVSLAINGWTVLGIIFFVLAVVVSGLLWGKLLAKLYNKPITASDAIRIHSASWILKYIPGQAGSYLNKIAWGVKKGISKKTITTSFIYENVMMIFAGFILSLPVFIMFRHELGNNLATFLPLLILIPMLIVLYRPFFYGILNFVFKKFKKKPFKHEDFLSTKALLSYQFGYLLPRLLNGVGFVFIAGALLPVQPHMYVGLAATYILASIVGLLAIFVPSGLGVREAVIVLFASVYFPVEQAIVLSLVVRLYATIADVGVALVYLTLNKGRIKQQ